MAHARRSRLKFSPVMAFPVVFILATSAYAFYWHHLGSAAEETLAAWATARRAEGYYVSHGEIDVSGFPGTLAVRVASPRIEAPPTAGGWTWRAPAVTARLSPLGIGPVTVEARERHEFRLPSNFGGGAGTLVAAKAEVKAAVDSRGSPERISVAIEKGRIEGAAAPVQVAHLLAVAEWPKAGKAGPPSPSIVVSLDGKDIDLPPALGLPLGPRAERVNLRAGVLGTIRPGNIFKSLNDWREEGGTISLDSLDVHWEPLAMYATGTLALDDQLQPIAALTASIRGFFEAVDSLSRTGVVRPRDASMAKVVLGMLMKPSPDGGRPSISLPLTIQDRTFFAGPARLAKLGDIHWSVEHVTAPPPITAPPPPEQAAPPEQEPGAE